MAHQAHALFQPTDRRCRADGDRVGDIARRLCGISVHGVIFTHL
jgi:hypothetical protein